MKKFLIIDTHALLHRAFHALPPLTTSTGEEVGALYGFSSMLLKVLKDERPDFVAAAVDLPLPTFRHKAYAAYKATREKTKNALIAQIQKMPRFLEAFGIPQFSKEGYEADDVIATLVEKAHGAKAKNVQSVIFTGDFDALQLVREDVSVLTPQRHAGGEFRTYDSKAVEARFGVTPGQYAEFKMLVGDPSDNIPGVKGVGPKTAAALLREFGNLDAAARATKQKDIPKGLPAVLTRKISFTERELRVLRDLVMLRRDVPLLDFSWEDCRWRGGNPKALQALFSEFGFRTLLSRVLGSVKEPSAKGVQAQAAFFPQEEPWEEREKELRAKIAAAEEAGIFSKTVAELERNLIPVIHGMEKAGILVDARHLTGLKRDFTQRRDALAQQVFGATGSVFNLASSQQVAKVLFEDLKLTAKGLRKTGSGARLSAAASELEKLKHAHPAVPFILEWREVAKLLSTYVETLPKLIAQKDGRIHTTFDPLGTETGRIASRNPNLQNIPKRSELGNKIRNAFIVPPGSRFISADYSQIELRVAAVLAADTGLLEIFRSGKDVHTATASRLFGVAYDAVAPHMRDRAKTINFGVLYGIGPRRLAETSGLSFEEAQAFIAEYFAAFPGIARYVAEAKDKVLRNGFAETFFGRRRLMPGIASQNHQERAQAERIAVNMPIQGTATGDLIKMAMVAVWERIVAKDADVKLLLQVHDELLFEVPERKVDGIIPEIRAAMEHIPSFPEVLSVRVLHGERWGELL